MLQSESNCNQLIKIIKVNKGEPLQSSRGDQIEQMKEKVLEAQRDLLALQEKKKQVESHVQRELAAISRKHRSAEMDVRILELRLKDRD